MNDSEFDEFIRRKFREGAPEIPESYYQKIDEMLEKSSKEEPKKPPVFRTKVAVILALVFLVGATSAFAGVRVYQERLQSMSEEEKEGIDEGIQESKMNQDHYSRELTSGENSRLKELDKAYRNGLFPKYELQEAVKISDVDVSKTGLKYCYENSTFYLPDPEMTDEELLEIIDFRYKRDYAVEDRNDESETLPDEKTEITEAEAVELAKKYAKQLFHVTVDDEADVAVEYDTEMRIDNSLKSNYSVKITRSEWDYSILMDLIPESGKWRFAFLKYEDKDKFTKNIKVNEDEYIAFENEIWDCIDSICNRDEVEKIVLTYDYMKNTNELYLGEVKYAVELENGEGYVFERYVLSKNIRSGNYWREITSFWHEHDKNIKSAKQKGMDVHQRKLVLYKK